MRYTIASERSHRSPQPTGLRSDNGRVATDAMGESMPDGLRHAIEHGAAHTLCDLMVADLVLFPDAEFPGSLEYGTRCETCIQLVGPQRDET